GNHEPAVRWRAADAPSRRRPGAPAGRSRRGPSGHGIPRCAPAAGAAAARGGVRGHPGDGRGARLRSDAGGPARPRRPPAAAAGGRAAAGRGRANPAPAPGGPGGPKGPGGPTGPGGRGGRGGGGGFDDDDELDEPRRTGWRRFIPSWKIVLASIAVLTAGL